MHNLTTDELGGIPSPNGQATANGVARQLSLLDEFFAAFGYAEDAPIHLRAFAPKGIKGLTPAKLVTTRKQLVSDVDIQRRLISLNETRGVYFVVNAGGDKASDIERFTAFFVESDTASLEAQHAKLSAAPIQPSIRVETKRSVHAYWLISGACAADEWREVQQRLISYFDGDRAISDASRVMRLPFLDHVTINAETGEQARQTVKLAAFEPHKRYTLEEMRSAFPSAAENRAPAESAGVFGKTAAEVAALNRSAAVTSDPQRDRELACEALRYLSDERCNDRKGWIDVGYAVFNTFDGDDAGLALWDDWSKRSPKYEPDGCEREWASFGGLRAERLTVASLIYWAREDSSEYRALEESRRAERRLEIAEWRADEEQHTDLGNARRLVRRYGDSARYDYNRKLWFAWDGTLWTEHAEHAVMRMAKETVTALYADAARIDDPDKRQALIKHALRSESAKSLRAMLDLARSEPGIQADAAKFDTAPHLLNVLNGTIDLQTGELREHRREDMLTKLAAVNYEPRMSSPLWNAFLDRIFNGNQSLIRFMQRAIGYTLTGETGEQCLFVLHGEGANGKSTLLEVMATLTGNYSTPVRTEALMKHKWTGASGHNEDIANLRGARFVSAVETEAGQKFAEKLLKQITGGDTITASRKHEHNISFRPAFKLWLAANHKPEIEGTDEAIWRRIHLIPFDVTIPEPERDHNLSKKLCAETELSGILAWCVQGASEYYRDGLGVAEEVKRATAEYRNEQDSLAEFITELCEVQEAATVSASQLYNCFEEWCRGSGDEVPTVKAFAAMMKAHGFKAGRNNRGKFWHGIRLKPLAPVQQLSAANTLGAQFMENLKTVQGGASNGAR